MASPAVIQGSGKDWLRSEVWSLLSDRPARVGLLMWSHAVLLSGTIVGPVVRARIVREAWPQISLRCYVVSHRFQSFSNKLCIEHGYGVQGDVPDDIMKVDQVRLCRAGIVLEVVRVNTESGSGNTDRGKQVIAFVSTVYSTEAKLASGDDGIHLMSDFIGVCLPYGLDPEEKASPLLPVVGAVCCKGHSPRCFPTQQESDVVTEEQLNKDQEQWVRYGHLLGPAPAELWFLRHGLCLSAFEEADGFD